MLLRISFVVESATAAEASLTRSLVAGSETAQICYEVVAGQCHRKAPSKSWQSEKKVGGSQVQCTWQITQRNFAC
jgi:hypothetical protein